MHSRAGQRGAMLLEVLVAILIFSFGILGIVGLQAQSIRHINDAQFRGEAVFLANSLISRMWTEDRTTLAANYGSTSGPGYVAFRDLVQRVPAGLPGSTISGNEPLVTVTTPGPSINSSNIAVTIRWQLPGEATPHQYQATAVLGQN